MYLIQINDNNNNYLNFIKKKFNFELKDRNIKLIYKKTKNFMIKLIDDNRNIIYKTQSKNKIFYIFFIIDNLPNRKKQIIYKIRNKEFTSDYSQTKNPRNLCFNNIDSNKINHCFNDRTHHTCCSLGPKARKYSNKSGNPIGKAAESLILDNREYYNWCTCSGSQVCSYYANKFNDGTRIKFMYNPRNRSIYYNVPFHLEKKYTRLFGINFHKTPGIY